MLQKKREIFIHDDNIAAENDDADDGGLAVVPTDEHDDDKCKFLLKGVYAFFFLFLKNYEFYSIEKRKDITKNTHTTKHFLQCHLRMRKKNIVYL